MKILVINTSIFTVPLTGYGGLEQVAWDCADGLGKLGHRVSLISPLGSTPPTNGTLLPTTPGEQEKETWLKYRERFKDYDAIIDHSWSKASYISRMGGLAVPVLGVCHAPGATMYAISPRIAKPCFVGLSEDHAAACTEHWKIKVEVCYNGVNPDSYPMQRSLYDRYLFCARFSTIKGPDIALGACQRAGVPLDLVGDDKITNEPWYSDTIKNLCDGTRFRYVGPQTRKEVVSWYSKAKALLHPIQRYREPFGLTIIEAALCGCPVIAWDNGSMRELILPGETGFLVKSIDEMADLIRTDAVSAIKPETCRMQGLKFSVEKMARRYEVLAKQAVKEGGW